MIKIKKSILTMSLIIIIICCLLGGMIIGCSITPGSIVRTETKIVTEPCEHVDINEVGLLEQSSTPHCRDCDIPFQRILYDSNNEITFIYTYFYEYVQGYSHKLNLKNVEILRIQADGTSAIVKR